MFVQCELNNFNRFNFLFYVLVDFEMNPKKKNCYKYCLLIGHVV